MDPLPSREREYLRDLAKKQLEIANLPEMKEKTELWYAHNECRAQRPVFTIELNTFLSELMPPYVCQSEEGRSMELQLQTNLLAHQWLHDDRVIPDFFQVRSPCQFHAFGYRIQRKYATMSSGKESIGYHLDVVIEDLERDFHLLHPSISIVEPPEPNEYRKLCEDTIGDILPVRYCYGTFGYSLSRQLLQLMGMEGMMMALYDYPELVHRAMRMLTDDLLRHMDRLEECGVLTLNNGNVLVGQGTRGFTHELPAADYESRDRVLFRDMWGQLDSQETVGISPDMFEEFFFPYYREIAARFGFLSYGCCEPVHAVWDNCLSKLSNLKKVSISPWCDQEMMGDRLRGTKIIFHRKPRPDYLGVDKQFQEEGFREHIRETLEAARGCTVEFSYRDVYSLCGEPWRANRVYQIALEAFDKYWR